MSRSLIIVNYRTAELAARAAESARHASAEPLEVIIVDNSCDEAEAERLRSIPDAAVIVSESNRGYSGGINLALAKARGTSIIVSNPDVVFFGHCIDLLTESLSDSVGMTGPSLSADASHRWLFPPPDLSTLGTKADQALATRSDLWMRWRMERRARERIAFWALSGPSPVRVLSGAVLCFSRRTWDRIGDFDERFPLYFEEIDYMKRITLAGLEIHYVPEAKCQHLYAQSSSQSPDAAAKYFHSEMEYFRKWEPERLIRSVMKLARPRPGGEPKSLHHGWEPLRLARERTGGTVVEISTTADFESAVGAFAKGEQIELPTEAFARYRGVPLFARVADRRSGKSIEIYRLAGID